MDDSKRLDSRELSTLPATEDTLDRLDRAAESLDLAAGGQAPPNPYRQAAAALRRQFRRVNAVEQNGCGIPAGSP